MPGVKQRKVAVVGSRSVGKSSLAVRFVDGGFMDSYYPTIENTFSKTVTHAGTNYGLEIVDTAGQDEYSLLNSKHFIGIHGYVIVYSVASKSSFDMIQIIYDKILNHLGAEWVPVVIVGNKCDLKIEQRQITAAQGKTLAESLKCRFTEASARDGTNVAKVFQLIIAQVEGSPTPSEPTGGSKCMLM